ncbi:hypothetical protein [Cohnella candidum]|uniref:Uncharacterized protein n=1 Tax=Cohnella candidum TaxID=2674991 RepID=A0A3G3JXN0_9BACL|nr:hypothetical protein [Cohnella candidum]AYQ72269.1 hypothetical protein EAV92_06620 [Cohnella candidum]
MIIKHGSCGCGCGTCGGRRKHKHHNHKHRKHKHRKYSKNRPETRLLFVKCGCHKRRKHA